MAHTRDKGSAEGCAAFPRRATWRRSAGLQAIHLRHLHVHQHHVVWLSLDRLDRFEPVARHVRPVAHLPRQPQRQLPVHRIVFRQEDVQRMTRRHRRVGFRR
jgi:hypothetical protein